MILSRIMWPRLWAAWSIQLPAWLTDPEHPWLFAIASAAIVLAAICLRPGNRGLLRGPIILLVTHSVFCALDVALHDSTTTSLDRLLDAIAFFFVLASIGRSAILILTHGVLLRFGSPVARIFLDILQLVVFAAALLFVLVNAKVPTTQLFAGSAVLTAVVTAVLGFAFRDTLGNLVAGLAIHAQRPFEVDDWIQFDEFAHHVGKVLEINWRATKVITLDDVEVILPNGELAQAPIRNFTKPHPWSRRSMYVIAPYEVPPNRVRSIILEAIADSWGVLKHPAPSVVTNEFTDRGIEYWIRIWTEQFGFRDKVDGGVRDRIWYALARNGIAIPVATHAVRVRQMPQLEDDSNGTETRVDRCRAELSEVDIFAALPEESLRRLASLACDHLFAESEVIIRQGEQGAIFYFIEEGELSVTVAHEGAAPVEIARLGPGRFFGEMSLMTGELRAATVTALTECRLLSISKSAFETILRDHPEFAERISKSLAERRVELDTVRSESRENAERAARDRQKDIFERIRQFFSL